MQLVECLKRLVVDLLTNFGVPGRYVIATDIVKVSMYLCKDAIMALNLLSSSFNGR
jgi:hypothetical protein